MAENLIGLLLETFVLGVPILLPLVAYLIPRTVKKIALLSLSEGKTDHLLRYLAQVISQTLLAVFFIYLYVIFYTQTMPGLSPSYFFFAVFQSAFLSELMYATLKTFIYEKAISYFERDSVEIKERMDALSGKLILGAPYNSEKSSTRKAIKMEKEYLDSHLGEERKTIARIRREVNRIYLSRKYSKYAKLAGFIVIVVGYLIITLFINYAMRPSSPVDVLSAVILGILVASFGLSADFMEERACRKIKQLERIARINETKKERGRRPRSKGPPDQKLESHQGLNPTASRIAAGKG